MSELQRLEALAVALQSLSRVYLLLIGVLVLLFFTQVRLIQLSRRLRALEKKAS